MALAEDDRQLLRFLWESGVRPGIRLTVGEVAPYAGTISVQLEALARAGKAFYSTE